MLPQSLRAGRDESELAVPLPRPLAGPVTSMKVTEFKDYLACPYRYYLKQRLELKTLEDAAEELDARQFGSLLHDVLALFGAGPLADCSSAGELRKALSELLDQTVSERFGAAVYPAVRIQAEQVRLRLAAFAEWQARRRSEGWRIHAIEKDVTDDQAFLLVDGRKMYLRGRIDRIDVHEGDASTIVFDYKTGDTAKTPDKSHRERGVWVDLQLPLYRHLVKALGIEQPVQLGYILLPKDTSRVGHELAAWTDDDLAAADGAAATVIRGIRSETFWPPATDPAFFCEEFAAICQDDLFGAAGLVADELPDGLTGGSPDGDS